jgi:fido (protein-threonine AMPylation protein)
MLKRIDAPFTPEQVQALNEYQEKLCFHPFTCGNGSHHRILVATPDGWVCRDCDYTQNWAHAFMAERQI